MASTPIEEIKSRIDIVDLVGSYVRLQKAGVNFKARCPFHEEKTPSFFVSPSRQSWHCFGCNRGGDIFSFLQEIEGIDFSEALRILAQRAGVELRRESREARDARERLFEMHELATAFFITQLEKSSAGKRAREYLLSRGLHDETIVAFRLGWAPEQGDALSSFLHSRGFSREEIERAGLASRDKGYGIRDKFRGRIMFPIADGNDRVIAFTGRIFGREEGPYDPKYLNSPETPIFEKSKTLYALNVARKAIRKEGKAVFVEGQMDCLMAHQAGTTNVVATSGTALTPTQLTIIRRLADGVIFAYDADRAGIEAARRGIERALEAGFSVRLAIVPSGKDPADFIREDAEGWRRLLREEAKPVIGFLLDDAVARYGLETIEAKRSVAKEVFPMIARMGNAVEKAEWIDAVRLRLGLTQASVEELWQEVMKHAPKEPIPTPAASQKDTVSSQSAPAQRREVLEEHLLALLLLADAVEGETMEELFSVPHLRELYGVLAELGTAGRAREDRLSAFRDLVAEELRMHAERIAFSAEALAETVRDLDAELRACRREIEALMLRDRLDAISLEIEAAERAGDELRVSELTERFRKESAALSALFE